MSRLEFDFESILDSIFDSPEDQVETVNLLLHGTVHVHPVLEEINQD